MNPAPTQTTPIQVASPQSQSPPDDKPQLLPLIQALEHARRTRVLVYWLSDLARMSEPVVAPLYDQLSRIGRQSALDLYLFTRGGDTEVPWRLVTLIREFCDRFAVLVAYRAHSAGTVLAMGANEIVMTALGVLSPIDPSRTHPLLPRREGAAEAEPISVQDMRHAMRFIRETAAPGADTPYTPDAMAEIVTALFEKIHPLAIGAIEQSYALAKLVAARCLGTHMDPEGGRERIQGIVDKLCDAYMSHNYQINRNEAREIGLKAIDAPPDVDKAMMDLLKFYLGRSLGLPSQPLRQGQVLKLHIAWLDSTDLQMRVEASYEVGPENQMKVTGDRWVPY